MKNNRMKPLPLTFVVDDDVAIQGCLKALLGTWGIRALTFSSAQTFLESYCDEWTGCLLVDHRMPGMSGIDLLNELRHRGSSLSTVLITGHGDAELLQQAIDAGAVDVLEKPFRVEKLKNIMERQWPELFQGDKSAGEA